MTRIAVRVVLAVVLIGVGWSLGRAQGSRPDFEIIVRAPGGGTTVECVRGCELAWAGRGLNPAAAPQADFTFRCAGETCSSGAIAGWVVR